MKHYDRRFLIGGIVLAIVIFGASLLLYPDWAADVRALIALAVLAVTAAFGFLANFRQAVESDPREPEGDSPPARQVNTGGGPYYEGKVETGGGDFVGRDSIAGDQTHIGNVSGNSTVVVGNGNVVNGNQPAVDPAALRVAYLNHVVQTTGLLQLSGIDPKAATGDSQSSLSLAAVYTALLTQGSDEPEKLLRGAGRDTEREPRKLSALEQANRHSRLVLLGDPGSGKSTFVNFMALCLAGEELGLEEANLRLLTLPLPVERRREEKEEPQHQPWDHGALLPLRVVLRDFAARGLPAPGEAATARHLWQFITEDLGAANLGEFVPLLNKALREQGGLLLVDGLDEVPEADRRRVQIRQAVESFAGSYPRVRILVTCRTYAYQIHERKPEEDWRLNGFADAALAPFSRPQIERFVERWYAHIAEVRRLNPADAQGRAVLLKGAIFASDRLLGLAERPLLLTLMASLHAWRGGSLPEKREQLYADTVDLLLDWWESPKSVRNAQGQIMVQQSSLAEWLRVDRERVRALLNELAYQAHAAQSGLVGTADVAEGGLVSGLMALTSNPDVNPARLVEYLRDRAGLLLPRGSGVYTFPHRTFQEYLAACYLTDHDYPENVAELACADFNRWREVALLACAKAGRGSAAAVWSLVDALCYQDTPAETPGTEGALWGAHLAAQALGESADLAKVSERNRPRLERVRAWLVHILRHSALPARERAVAGDNLARLGDPRREVMTLEGMAFCFVPSGSFQMGEEKNVQTVEVPAFWIGRHPVSNAQFGHFVAAGGYREERYWPEAKKAGCWKKAGFQGSFDDEPRDRPVSFGDPFGLPNHPVVGVSWYEAATFCCWLDELAHARGWLGAEWQLCLPEMTQWEKTARGGVQIPVQAITAALSSLPVPAPVAWQQNPFPHRDYPWEGKFRPENANTIEAGVGATSALGCFPLGAGPYGSLDQSGNVWEWQQDLYDKDKEDSHVLRGGSWFNVERFARCSPRLRYLPDGFNFDFGFRVVVCPHSDLTPA